MRMAKNLKGSDAAIPFVSSWSPNGTMLVIIFVILNFLLLSNEVEIMIQI